MLTGIGTVKMGTRGIEEWDLGVGRNLGDHLVANLHFTLENVGWRCS